MAGPIIPTPPGIDNWWTQNQGGKTSPFKAAPDPFQGAFNTVSGTTDVNSPLGNMEINVKPMQQFLISKGYKLTADGQLGAETKSALADFLNPSNVGPKIGLALKGTPITGKRDPSLWNSMHGKTAGVMPGTTPAPNADPPSASGGQTKQAAYTDPFAALGKQGGAIGNLLSSGLAGQIADGTYAPVIADLQNQLGMLPGQTKQNKADITNWMNQVLSSLATGTSASDAGYSAASSSAQDAAKGIAASLGGSDNAASPEIASTGAQASDMFSALKGNQDAFSQNMQPILNLEKTSQLTNQDNQSAALQRDLMAQLAGAKGQEAGLSGQTQMQIDQYNNNLLQQRFQNKFGASQASSATQIAGGQAYLNNLYKGAQINHLNNETPKPSSGTFAGTSTKALTGMAQQIVSAVKAQRAANPQLGAASIVGLVNHLIGASFPSDNLGNAKLAAWRNQIFQILGIDPKTQSLNP